MPQGRSNGQTLSVLLRSRVEARKVRSVANLLKHSQIYDLRLKMISRRTISCLGTCLIPLESSHDRLTGEIVTIEISCIRIDRKFQLA